MPCGLANLFQQLRFEKNATASRPILAKNVYEPNTTFGMLLEICMVIKFYLDLIILLWSAHSNDTDASS